VSDFHTSEIERGVNELLYGDSVKRAKISLKDRAMKPEVLIAFNLSSCTLS
jgi:hypothetical protein